jgi:hypothetical protein
LIISITARPLDGYGTLKLANVYNDPSFVREVLSYEIARKYMPASQVEDVLDVDRLLWMLAFDILTVNL